MNETATPSPSNSNYMESPNRFVTARDIKALTTLSKPSVDRYERRGDFPKRIRLSYSRVVWRYGEVMDWLDTKAAERDEPAGGA